MRLRGLNPLLAAVSTPTCAPVLVGTRLRGGTANSARGAASFVAEAITTARAAGATGLLIARMDSAFYNGAPSRRVAAPACGSRSPPGWTARSPRRSRRSPRTPGRPIRYPNAIFDDDEQRWISDAEVAEISYTAFDQQQETSGDRPADRAPGPPPGPTRHGQGELLPAWRHHAIFTDSPLPMLAAETDHRDHAIIEQVIADLIDGPLAHLPSGDFAANAAWLTCAGIAHNLLRAAARLASGATARPAPPPCAAS